MTISLLIGMGVPQQLCGLGVTLSLDMASQKSV